MPQVTRRAVVASTLAFLVQLTLFVPSLLAQRVDWDWRAYPGSANLPAGNYVTPVRDQGSAGSCWAFGAAAVLEAKWAITNKVSNPTLDVSEQNLICAGIANGFGDANGGYEFSALDYIRDTGIVNEAKMPYTASNTSPNWPLKSPYTLYRCTSDSLFINNTNLTTIKNALQNYGPLVVAIMANTDWYWPANPPVYGSAGEAVAATDDSLHGLGAIPLDPAGSINHAVLITGFTDDPTVSGGGYFHIKNSWGKAWGQSGYGFVRYPSVTGTSDHRISGINGSIYTVYVPEPATQFVLCLGASALAFRRRRMAA